MFKAVLEPFVSRLDKVEAKSKELGFLFLDLTPPLRAAAGEPTVEILLRNAVFIVIPDMNPDATAAGSCNDPDDGKTSQWRFNPAAIDRMMPGMIGPMTVESKGIWDRLVRFVDQGGRIDFCFNIHQGGMDNWWGVYELADPKASSAPSK